MKLYGIANCTTVKKARTWLESHGVEYEFYDFKKQGVTEAMIAGWLKQVGWQKLLKKTGPTWGQLPDAVKASIKDDASALALLLAKPNVIKRPVLERKGKVLATGFSGQYDENLFARPSPQPSGGTTSQSTKPASGQGAGYPASGRGGKRIKSIVDS